MFNAALSALHRYTYEYVHKTIMHLNNLCTYKPPAVIPNHSTPSRASAPVPDRPRTRR